MPSLTWKVKSVGREVYFTFDDGPHPTLTPWVIEQLKLYDAKATFFCVGENVGRFPEAYRQIIEAGHKTGNHSYHHLNGWKTSREAYVKDISKCREMVDSELFRPPYGRITPAQIRILKGKYKLVMWNLLSGDYDKNLVVEKAIEKLKASVSPGSIIVFHDSEKASDNLKIMLPEMLRFCAKNGFTFAHL
jgi:peptidoglycan/xylan/chitin deacetylase (PgdA/CDA1 family)